MIQIAIKTNERRRRRTISDRILNGWFMVVFQLWMIISGGLSGIMIGAIILNEISPGHPFFLTVKGICESIRNVF